MIILKKVLLCISIALLLIVVPQQISAAEPPPEAVQLINPIGGTKAKPEGVQNISDIVGVAIKQITGILGSLALVMFVYGGFQWLTSAGNPEKVKKGSGAMIWSAIGIVIIFSSYAILTLVFKALKG